MEKVLNVLKFGLQILFPKTCLVCGRNYDYICPACEGVIEYVDKFVCLVCHRPAFDGFVHINCLSKFTPNRFLAAFMYKGPIRRALVNAKYRGKIFDLYGRLCPLAASYFDEIGLEIGKDAVLIPIPVHYKKYMKRGFNHAEIVAELWSKHYGVSCVDALKKVKETETQSLLNRKERKESVEGAFEVRSELLNKISGKDVVLVDDIATTGATFLEASKTLRKLGSRGPRFIYCMALAYDARRDIIRSG